MLRLTNEPMSLRVLTTKAEQSLTKPLSTSPHQKLLLLIHQQLCSPIFDKDREKREADRYNATFSQKRGVIIITEK